MSARCRESEQKNDKKMLNKSKKNRRELEELQNFIFPTENIQEWNISQAVKLRLKGFSYREIEKRLEFSTSFIAPTHRKYLAGGVAALKLKYPG